MYKKKLNKQPPQQNSTSYAPSIQDLNVLLLPATSFCALGSPLGASVIPEKGAKPALFFFLSFFFFLPSPSSACSTDLAFA